MKLISKIKIKLGFCICKGCFRKATLDIEIPAINYKGKVCKECFNKLVGLDIFNPKEVK